MEEFNSIETKSKEEIWQQKRLEIDGIGDKLGLGIDEGVKDTVTVFQVLDINTTGSHEGKVDRYPVPYIDVECSNIYELNEGLDNAESEEEKESILKEIIIGNIGERRKILAYIEEFYRDREVSFEAKIGIQTLARGWSRIQSQGAELQEVETDSDLKKKRLELFQKEMHEFTEFLKSKFFMI